MVALIGVLDGSPRLAVGMLVVAQLIDGIDGPLARRWDIAEVLPKYDGYLLDLVIDYVTCVLVPAVFAWQFHVVPHSAQGKIAIALLLGTSALWFSRTDMMTDDHWFRGFPAVWNLVVPTLWLTSLTGGIAVIVLVVLSLLSLTDVEFAHPVQVVRQRRAHIAFMAWWIAAVVGLTIVAPWRSLATDVLLLFGPAWVATTTLLREQERRRSLLITAPAIITPPTWAPIDSSANRRPANGQGSTKGRTGG